MVRTGPWLGLLGHLVLLAALAMTVGLSPFGLLLGGLSGVAGLVLLRRGLHRSGASSFGPANAVTLTRAVLVGGILGLVASGRDRWPAVVLAVLVLLLDNADGRVARRTRTVSELGARFDLEVDAFLILLLSIAVARTAGWWVLVIGAARYLLLVAGWHRLWLQQPSPPRYWCKVVAVIQGVVLTVALTGLLPHPVMVAAVAIALLLLSESFGREVFWKWRHRTPAPLAVLRPRRAPRQLRTTDRHRMPCPTVHRRHLHGQG